MVQRWSCDIVSANEVGGEAWSGTWLGSREGFLTDTNEACRKTSFFLPLDLAVFGHLPGIAIAVKEDNTEGGGQSLENRCRPQLPGIPVLILEHFLLCKMGCPMIVLKLLSHAFSVTYSPHKSILTNVVNYFAPCVPHEKLNLKEIYSIYSKS